MASDSTIHDLTAVLRARPTVRFGDDVEPGRRAQLDACQASRGLERTEHGATLAITTDPAQAAGVPRVYCPFAGAERWCRPCRLTCS